MRLLCCGSRTWEDAEIIRKWLIQLRPDLVIHGGALGADSLSGREAEKLGISVKVFPANWRKYGLRAGPLRNQQMIEDSPDVLIAFWNGRSRGTADMIARGLKYMEGTPNFRVLIIDPDGQQVKREVIADPSNSANKVCA